MYPILRLAQLTLTCGRAVAWPFFAACFSEVMVIRLASLFVLGASFMVL
jgi:hypothetical protein